MIDPALWPALVTLGIVLAMFVLFVREVYPPEVTAMAGASALLVTGILPVDRLLSVFSNPAPLTVGAMFILTGALIRTGSLDAFTRWISRGAERFPRRVLGGFAGFTATASAFMNNTPVVVMMIPVAVSLSKQLNITASKLLIPLSYMAIMGGMLTLIGTSTNLLVDGVARRSGLEPFGLFEVTPLALIVVLCGTVFLGFAAPRFLPQRNAMLDFLGTRKNLKFFTEVVIPEGSNLIGREVLAIDQFTRPGMTVIDVLRGDESLRRDLKGVMLMAGDRIVIRTGVNELLGLRDSKSLSLIGQIDAVSQKSTVTVEALITPGCRMIGRVLGSLRLRRRYGVYPLAVHRRAARVGSLLDDIRIRVGDTLLLEGAPDDIQRLANEQQLADLTRPTERPYRRERAPIVIGILLLVVIGGALNILPIAGLAVIGVTIALLTHCIDAEEAFESIEGRLLALIFSMLAVGVALEDTGAIQIIVDAILPFVMNLSPQLVLWIVFIMASILTEMVSNNAVAIVMTPIAITLANALGVDPRPFVVAVMVAASASFATPIGYQTNTLVYAPGGYRFTDYMILGIPMNIGISVIAVVFIPMFWPL